MTQLTILKCARKFLKNKKKKKSLISFAHETRRKIKYTPAVNNVFGWRKLNMRLCAYFHTCPHGGKSKISILLRR